MAVNLDDETIAKIADAVANRLKGNVVNDNTMTFDQARKHLFNNKSRDWVKYYLFSKYPELLTSHGGWITPPVKQGVRIKILDVKAVKQWLNDHMHQIDWNAPDPVTLERRYGLTKSTKRNK